MNHRISHNGTEYISQRLAGCQARSHIGTEHISQKWVGSEAAIAGKPAPTGFAVYQHLISEIVIANRLAPTGTALKTETIRPAQQRYGESAR